MQSRALPRWSTLLLPIWLALLVRAIGLGDQSLWYDEGYTVMFARNDIITILTQSGRLELNTPLHYLALSGWMAGAGSSEFAVRLLSVFAGVVTVALAARLAQPNCATGLARYAGPGFIVAMALALWPTSVALSRETRMYSLAVCLSVLSVALMLRAMRHPRRRWWWSWAVATVAAFSAHVLCAFVAAGQILVVALWWWRSRHGRQQRSPQPIIAAGVAAALIILWGAWLVSFSSQYGTTFTDRLNYWVMLQKSVLSIFAPQLPPDDQVDLPATLAMAVVIVALALSPPRARIVMAIGILAIAGITALSSITGKFAPRYPQVAVPLIVVGLAFARLPAWPRSMAGALAMLLAGAGLVTARAAPAHANEDFRGVAAFLRANVRSDETILLVSGHFAPVFAYYYGDAGWVALPDDPVLDIRNTLRYDTAAPALNRALADKRGAWLLLWQDLIIDPGGIAQTLLIHQAGGADFDSRDFNGLRLLHYGFDPYRPLPEALAPARLEQNNQISANGVERGISALGCEMLRPARSGDANLEVICHWLLTPPPPQNILPFDVRVSLSLRDEAGAVRARHEQLLAPINGMPARWGDFPLTALYRIPMSPDLPPGQYTITAQPGLNGEMLAPQVTFKLTLAP